VRNPRVSLENRDFAVQGLVEGGTSANVRVLRSVAEDARNTEFLRASAVRAFLTLEKGGTQLKRWQQSRDSILARLAGSALEDVQ
jgi:hypothetical protein